MIVILQQSPAPAQNSQPHPTPGASLPKPASAAASPARVPGKPAGDPAKTAAEQPFIDRLIPAWQPARGVSQAAITLAAVLVLMLLVGGITSLGRRAVFFLKQREWRHPPPRIRAWKLGPEGMSYELSQEAQLENEQLRVLTERVDAAVSSVQIISDRLPGLNLNPADRATGLHPSHDGVENAHA